jgi:hypothetical protein
LKHTSSLATKLPILMLATMMPKLAPMLPVGETQRPKQLQAYNH